MNSRNDLLVLEVPRQERVDIWLSFRQFFHALDHVIVEDKTVGFHGLDEIIKHCANMHLITLLSRRGSSMSQATDIGHLVKAIIDAITIKLHISIITTKKITGHVLARLFWKPYKAMFFTFGTAASDELPPDQ